MRVVYFPMISAKNVQASSSYQWFLAFRRHLLLQDPKAVFYVVTPQMGEGESWKEGADWSGERTFEIPVRMYRNQFDDLGLITREFYDRFNERFGDCYFDVIIGERPALVPIIKKLVQFHMHGKSRKPLIVTRDQIILSTEWFRIDPNDELVQATGWVTAPVVFQSDHQAKKAIEVTGRHLKPHLVRRLAENHKVFPLGVDCADIDLNNMEERSQKHERITVNYSHKLFLEQKFIESLKIMDSTFAGGRPIHLQIVTGSAPAKMSMLKDARAFQYIEFYGHQSRAQFLRQMARAHVFISNSYYEDFSATVVEQIYTGLLPVLFDAPWSRYLVGDDYPYLFRDMAEGQAMLRLVVDNYEEIRAEWQEELQRRMKERFDLAHIIPAMADWIRGLHEERFAHLKQSQSLVDVVEEAYQSLPEEFGLEDLYAGIAKKAKSLDVRRDTESMATSAWLTADLMRQAHPDLHDLGTLPVRYRKSAASSAPLAPTPDS